MRHADRRRETGKMLMDVTKYLITVGFIGGILTDKLDTLTGVFIFVFASIAFIAAFYTIPPKGDN